MTQLDKKEEDMSLLKNQIEDIERENYLKNEERKILMINLEKDH